RRPLPVGLRRRGPPTGVGAVTRLARVGRSPRFARRTAIAGRRPRPSATGPRRSGRGSVLAWGGAGLRGDALPGVGRAARADGVRRERRQLLGVGDFLAARAVRPVLARTVPG